MSRIKEVACAGTSGYTFTVPRGYSPTVQIDVAGGSGGQGGSYYHGGGGGGGHAGRLTGTYTLNPGDKVDVYVGEGGKRGNYSYNGGAGGRSVQIGTYSGQGIFYPVTLNYAWSDFMNRNAVWVNPDGVSPVNATVTVTRNIVIPQSGWYNFVAAADNYMTMYLDGTDLLFSFGGFQGFYADASSARYVEAGTHTLTMNVTNWGGPAGFAVEVWHPNAYIIWTTRTQLNPDTYSYWMRGGNGGNTSADGNYIYPGAGGGGGATAVFVNGNLVLVAAGGGGGGAEGGHGAAGTAGTDGGSPRRLNPDGGGVGVNGTDGYDIGGTPGGGGGYVGGDQGDFIYYDDAPSGGASGGTNYIGGGNFTTGTYRGGGPGDGLRGYCIFNFNELGSGKVKVGGNWKQITNSYVKVGPQWKQITNAWVKQNGVWKVISGGSDITVSQISGNYG